MRALVTGSAGFVGSHLRAHLEAVGDEVIPVDHHNGDLTIPDVADDLVSTHRPEVIYHLAGASDVGASWRDPIGTWEANATATLYLLEAARANGVRRVLVVSSADVYGPVDETDLPLNEDSPVKPASPYAASKLAAESLARQAWLGHGLETILVRAFNHIGPGQRPDFVAPALAESVARNELTGESEIPIGNLSARRDFTDVRDVARAYRALVEAGNPGDTYCVCRGEDIAIQKLAEILVAMSNAPMTLAPDPDRYRPVDIPALRGDNTKLRATTGWSPEYTLEATLRELLDESRDRVRDGIPTQTSRS